MTMRVSVRGSHDAAELMREARKVAAFPPAAERRVKRAVERERMTHAYENRTSRLEESTVLAVVSESDDELVFEARQDADYGVYVQRKGLSRFNALVEEAAAELAAAMRIV